MKEDTIEQLKEWIKESEEKLKKYDSQDETGWSEFDKGIRGKEVNMPLVRNHISYYKEKIKKIENSSLNRFFIK